MRRCSARSPSARLGIPPERIRFVYGDTDLVTHGRGTIGSRSMMAAGGALVGAADRIIDRGKSIAAHLLEAAEADIEFADGRFRVAGTDSGIGIEALARRSYVPGALPLGEELGLSALLINRPGDATFPNGCHVAEVEVDPETGETALLPYVVVDDVGTVINPLLLKGQIHGGIAQGFGQVFGEHVRYDAAGQILTASFHGLCHAAGRRPLRPGGAGQPGADRDQPARREGRRGGGYGRRAAGADGRGGGRAAAARHRQLDMPATPERVWAAIRPAGTPPIA